MKIALIALAGLAVGGLLYAEAHGAQRLKWVFKPLASAMFIALGLAAGALESGFGLAILAGLICCAAGDLLLIPLGRRFFLAGMGAFALGHLAYIAAFAILGLAPGPWPLAALAAMSAISLAVLTRLWGQLGAFRAPVAFYCAIITAMVAASVAARAPSGGFFTFAILGAVGFAFSDIAVARDQFLRREFFNRLWGLPLYYAAQLTLAACVSAAAAG